jgi:hypothetical protein
VIEDVGCRINKRRWRASRVTYWVQVNGVKFDITREDYLAMIETRRGWVYNISVVRK